jgi:hypothetical protein
MKYLCAFLFSILFSVFSWAQTRQGVIDCRDRSVVQALEKPGSIVAIKILDCGQNVSILSAEGDYVQIQINATLIGFINAKNIKEQKVFRSQTERAETQTKETEPPASPALSKPAPVAAPPELPKNISSKGPHADKPWSVELHVKFFLGSHTSYEFGNPLPPHQAPLSRLEFPINNQWAGVEFRRSFSRFSAGGEFSRNLSEESSDWFKDSDWTDDANPGIKTIYSESHCRMEPSYMVLGDADLNIADWIKLPVWFDLRPVAGIRWQRLNLVTHDGVQTYPAPGDDTPPDSLSGDGIRFKQTYQQYFVGIKTALDMGWPRKLLRLKLLGQLDWAHVDGDNSDHHLLREGTRMTYEKTRGHAVHASLGLKANLAKNIKAGVDAEYFRIRTEGSHRLSDKGIFDVDIIWNNGVKAWSDQLSLTASLRYMF